MSEVGQRIYQMMQTQGCAADYLVISTPSAQAIASACTKDAHDYWYSGLASLGDACAAVQRNSHAWATVKLYYSTFYLSRAFLAFAGSAIEFIMSGNKYRHYLIPTAAGSSLTRIGGNTHDAVLRHVEASNAIPRLRGQPIGGKSAAEWLIAARNDANYITPRFPDPSPTAPTALIGQRGVRKVVQAYVEDPNLLYAFDPDHAIMAYPIAVARELVRAEAPAFDDAERSHLTSLFSDSSGPLSSIRPLFEA